MYQSVTDHTTVERTIWGCCPDAVLGGGVQISRVDLDFGYPDNVFRCERLKLDVLSIITSVSTMCHPLVILETHIRRGTSDVT